jgi:hypothetical protein
METAIVENSLSERRCWTPQRMRFCIAVPLLAFLSPQVTTAKTYKTNSSKLIKSGSLKIK